MPMDKHLQLSADQQFNATAVCTNAFRLPATGIDIAKGGRQLALRWVVKTAAVVSGTQTYELQIVSATASDGTTGQVVLLTTGTLTTARSAVLLADEKVIEMVIPPGLIPSTATHITGKVVGANSPDVTMDCYIVEAGAQQNWSPTAAAVTSVA